MFLYFISLFNHVFLGPYLSFILILNFHLLFYSKVMWSFCYNMSTVLWFIICYFDFFITLIFWNKALFLISTNAIDLFFKNITSIFMHIQFYYFWFYFNIIKSPSFDKFIFSSLFIVISIYFSLSHYFS